MSNSKPATAGPSACFGKDPFPRLCDIVTECALLAEAVDRLHAAVHHASHSVSSTQAGYASVANTFRESVARGAAIRACIAAAHADSSLGSMARQVGLQLQQASDEFGQFLALHAQAGNAAWKPGPQPQSPYLQRQKP